MRVLDMTNAAGRLDLALGEQGARIPERLRAKGWSAYHSGGFCFCASQPLPTNKVGLQAFAMVTDESGMEIPVDGEKCFVGLTLCTSEADYMLGESCWEVPTVEEAYRLAQALCEEWEACEVVALWDRGESERTKLRIIGIMLGDSLAAEYPVQ